MTFRQIIQSEIYLNSVLLSAYPIHSLVFHTVLGFKAPQGIYNLL